MLSYIFLCRLQPTRKAWRTVFYISAGVYILGTIFYFIFGSGERQKWAIEPTATVEAKAVQSPTAQIEAKTVPGPTAQIAASAVPRPSAQVEAKAVPGPTAQIAASAVPRPTAQIEAKAVPGPTAQIAANAVLDPTAKVQALKAPDIMVTLLLDGANEKKVRYEAGDTRNWTDAERQRRSEEIGVAVTQSRPKDGIQLCRSILVIMVVSLSN